MNNPITKTPFLFLLIPLIFGIVLNYYYATINWSIIISLFGIFIILLSYWVGQESQYRFRWLFGMGVIFAFVAIGGFSTYNQQQKMAYSINDSVQTYVGYITTTPQEKPRSVAYKIHLENEDINVVCYLERDSAQQKLTVGDEVMFVGKLQAFKNAGNPDDFDYKAYMYRQGFVASTYLSSASWLGTGKSHKSIATVALQWRQKIMDFYSSLGFSADEHAILSALTLGYQDTLSNDLKQGFRTTGTVHVLSVSGLHVGIIFGVISFLLSFIRHTSRFYRLRPLLIIILLWVYSFITGLPPSVVRASSMLTIFCLAEVFNRKSSSLNNLFIAAFFMLLYNPFQLFDIGFQLSCISVLSILVLHPLLTKAFDISHKYVRFVWNLFTLSLVAQLAAFPLCLYYFGTFPTYFFLANLLIVPLVTLIIYGVGLLTLAWAVSLLFSTYTDIILWLPTQIIQQLVKAMTYIVKLFESLPFSLIENVDVSFIQLVLLLATIVFILFSIIRNNSKTLIAALTTIVVLLSINIYKETRNKSEALIVFNSNSFSEIIYSRNGIEYRIDSLLIDSPNQVIKLNEKKTLIINNTKEIEVRKKQPYSTDYAIIMGESEFSIQTLDGVYDVDTLILDGSLKSYVRRQLTKECENRGIPFYDVSEKGAFRINF